MATKAQYILLGSSTANTTAAVTVPWVGELFPPFEYQFVNVLVAVSSLAGSPVSVSFQEDMGAAGFLETANTGSMSGTGNFFLVAGVNAGTNVPSTIKQISPLLGSGGRKQAVITQAGVAGTVTISIYVEPYNA